MSEVGERLWHFIRNPGRVLCALSQFVSLLALVSNINFPLIVLDPRESVDYWIPAVCQALCRTPGMGRLRPGWSLSPALLSSRKDSSGNTAVLWGQPRMVVQTRWRGTSESRRCLTGPGAWLVQWPDRMDRSIQAKAKPHGRETMWWSERLQHGIGVSEETTRGSWPPGHLPDGGQSKSHGFFTLKCIV